MGLSSAVWCGLLLTGLAWAEELHELRDLAVMTPPLKTITGPATVMGNTAGQPTFVRPKGESPDDPNSSRSPYQVMGWVGAVGLTYRAVLRGTSD
jgi:hypothetical protein